MPPPLIAAFAAYGDADQLAHGKDGDDPGLRYSEPGRVPHGTYTTKWFFAEQMKSFRPQQ